MFKRFALVPALLFFAACGMLDGGDPGPAPRSACYAAPALSSGGGATVTISGTVMLEDRTYDEDGFTGVACLPVRRVVVEAVSGATVVASGESGEDGTYSLTLPAAGDYYVRALAKSGSVYSLEVRDDRDNSIYAVSSDAITIHDGEAWDVRLSADIDGAGPAFNIYDSIVKTQKVIALHESGSIPLITAYWFDGKTSGTFYSLFQGEHAINILGVAGDTDAYDDSVIMHEMGHYAAAAFSKDSSPGGSHSILGHYDIRLSWSEGWANYFSSFVKAEQGEASAEVYVDTTGGTGTGVGTLNFSFNIDTPTEPALTTEADNEIAVANMLWNIYATGAAPHLGLGGAEMWDVFTNLLPLDGFVTFEGFYDHWIGGAGHSALQLAPLLQSRDISYFADAYEDDGTAATARALQPGGSEQHTFFPQGDLDWFSVSATAGTIYTFATSGMKDGCDTLITLYDSDGMTQLAQNDDAAAGTRASSITWTAPSSKTVYLLVEPYRPLTAADLEYASSPTWPPAVVKYGAYTIAVQ